MDSGIETIVLQAGIVVGSGSASFEMIRHLTDRQRALGRRLTLAERMADVLASAKEVVNPMFFGVLIITVVYVPILALTGIEGKMFRPMAVTVIFALVGSLASSHDWASSSAASATPSSIGSGEAWDTTSTEAPVTMSTSKTRSSVVFPRTAVPAALGETTVMWSSSS